MKVHQLTDFIKRMARRSGKISENLNANSEVIFINKDGKESDFYFQWCRERNALLLVENEEK